MTRREFLGTTVDAIAATSARSAVGGSGGQSPTGSRSSPVDLCYASGRELASMIRARRVSAREVMTAFLAQINRINPKVNAIVARLNDDRCLALAEEADRRLSAKSPVGPLHGLPWAFKDLEAAVGFPATSGSRSQNTCRRQTRSPSSACAAPASCRSAKPMCPSSAWAHTLTTRSMAPH